MSNSDGTLTISPTTGAVVASIANSVALPGNPTSKTQSFTDASTYIATDTFAQTVCRVQSVDYATTNGLPNSPTYNNGSSGVGATLTAGSNASLTIDGTSIPANARILVMGQSANAFQNGIYIVTNAGSGSAAWVLTRAPDFDTSAKISYYGLIQVLASTSSGIVSGSVFQLSNQAGVNGLTVGTTNITAVNQGSLLFQANLTNGKIFVGNSSGLATGVTLSGDASLSNTGVFAIYEYHFWQSVLTY